MIHVGDKKQNKIKLFISSCTSSSVLLRSSRTCRQKQWVYSPTWGHNVGILCYREKRPETKGCKVNVSQWKEATDLDQIAAANTSFICLQVQQIVCAFKNLPLNIWSELMLHHHPHPSGYSKLRIICNHLTQVCMKVTINPWLLLQAMSISPILITHTSRQNSAPLRIHLQDLDISFAVVQSIQPINIFLLHTSEYYLYLWRGKNKMKWFPNSCNYI